MTPEQALAILDNVTAQISVNRQQQNQICEALRVIAEAIKPESPKD